MANITATTDTSSPLSEASPSSLDEQFSRDPLLMMKEDDDAIAAGRTPPNFPRIVEELRAQRERFLAAEASGKKPGSRSHIASPKAAKTPTTLEDLGL
jgi:hypothetical protein